MLELHFENSDLQVFSEHSLENVSVVKDNFLSHVRRRQVMVENMRIHARAFCHCQSVSTHTYILKTCLI